MEQNKFNSILNESQQNFKQLFESDNNFTKAIKRKTSHNYNVYLEIIEKYPFIAKIMKNFYVAPMYCIYDIWVDNNRIYFYMNQSCGFDADVETLKLFKEHNINFQLPGNQDYNFSIGIEI